MKRDLYADITARILRELEKGTAPWLRPWTGDTDPFPINAGSHRPYRGINVLLLGLEAMQHGYSSQRWLTYRQTEALGAHVRKGEKATTVVFYTLREYPPDSNSEAGSVELKRVPLLRAFSVFNVDQIEGLGTEYLVPSPDNDWPPDELADHLLLSSQADIRHGGVQAYYHKGQDYIQLPERPAFFDAAGYYTTALHELTHWTAHIDRCNRQLNHRFGDEAYAMEELIAEMGSAFLCAHCRLQGQLQHTEYLASWLKVLNHDKRAILMAASRAQQAADYVLKLAGDQRQHEDEEQEALAA